MSSAGASYPRPPGWNPYRKPHKPKSPYGGPANFTIPGFTPDYNALLTGNSGYQSLLNTLGVQEGLAVEGRQGDIRRRLIEWGIIPDDMTGLEDIDPLTRSLAGQANASGVGQAARDDAYHALQLRKARNQLAARGIYSRGEPGAFTAESGREGTRYTTERFDKLKELQDYVSGVLSAYASGHAGREGQRAEGLDEAMDEIMADPENTATEAVNAAHISGTRGFYRGSDGRLYDQKQRPINVAKAKAHYQQMVAAAAKRGLSTKQIRNTWYGRRLRALGV